MQARSPSIRPTPEAVTSEIGEGQSMWVVRAWLQATDAGPKRMNCSSPHLWTKIKTLSVFNRRAVAIRDALQDEMPELNRDQANRAAWIAARAASNVITWPWNTPGNDNVDPETGEYAINLCATCGSALTMAPTLDGLQCRNGCEQLPEQEAQEFVEQLLRDDLAAQAVVSDKHANGASWASILRGLRRRPDWKVEVL